MADLRKLFVSIGFKPDQASISKVDKGVSRIRGMMVAVTAVAAVAGAGLFGLANSVAKSGDEARKTAQALGLTTETLQELAFAADISGVNNQAFTNSLRKLSSSAVEAGEGVATYKDEFDKLGISVKKADGTMKSSEELILDLADAFSKAPDSIEKTASATALLGRSGARLIPLLNSGRDGISDLRTEAQLLGGVMSDETARGNENFIDSITRLKFVVKGVKIFLANEVIPLFTEYITKAKDWALANKEIIQTKLAAFIRSTIRILRLWLGVISGIATRINALVQTLGGFEKVLGVVVKVMLGFIAIQFASALGYIAIGITGLISSLVTLKAGLITTQLAAIGLPLLIGAAVIALVLIFEDILAFFQGKDSITGALIETFSEKFPAAFSIASQAVSGIVALLRGLFDLVTAIGKIFLGIFTFDLDLIAEGAEDILDIFSNLIGNIVDLFTGKLVDGIKGALSFGRDKIAALGSFFGIGGGDGQQASTSVSAASIVPSNPSSLVNNNRQGGNVSATIAKVEVIVPPDTPADQASGVAEGLFATKFNDILVQAAADAEPGVEL